MLLFFLTDTQLLASISPRKAYQLSLLPLDQCVFSSDKPVIKIQ